MPLYEYQCTQCHQRVEAIQRFNDDPLTTCDACGGELERLLSAPAIQFKGGGWYVTDYAGKSSSAKEAGGDGKGVSASAEGKSSTDAGASDAKSAKASKDSSPDKGSAEKKAS